MLVHFKLALFSKLLRTLSSQARTLATSLTPYLKVEKIKECYLPLFNLGKTQLLPLAVKMFDQLKKAYKEKESNPAATTVFKKGCNPAGDDECVSTHSTIYYYCKYAL